MALRSRFVPLLLIVLLLGNSASPWGNEGHMMINRVAAEKLPLDMPSFLRSAAEQLAYLGPEPDRWREKTELALKLSQEADHFIDLELFEGITLPPDRYSYYRALETERRQNPAQADKFWPEKVGLQPYIAMEIFERLIVAFREYRHAVRDHRSTEFAERNATFYAGWLGHYVADASQPLHTTIHYAGWVGPNPNGYTTGHGIHGLFEATYVAANIRANDFAPLVKAPTELKDPFADYIAYLRSSNGLVEQVYSLEKAGSFTGKGTPAAFEFTTQRLAAGSQMLLDLWYTAWLDSAIRTSEHISPGPATK